MSQWVAIWPQVRRHVQYALLLPFDDSLFRRTVVVQRAPRRDCLNMQWLIKLAPRRDCLRINFWGSEPFLDISFQNLGGVLLDVLLPMHRRAKALDSSSGVEAISQCRR